MTNQKSGQTCLLCHKELPHYYKVPVCKNCKGQIGDGAKRAGAAAVAALGTTGFVFVMNGGAEKVKKYGPEVIKVVGAVVKRL